MGKYELMRALAANETYRQAFERFGIGEERTCCSDDQGVTAIERVDSCCCTPQPDQTGKGSPTFSVASAQPSARLMSSPSLPAKVLARRWRSQPSSFAAGSLRPGRTSSRRPSTAWGASMALDSKSNQLITEAIQAIRDGSPKTPPETGGGADRIFCTLFKHADFNPPFLFVSHLNWQTYKQVRADTLRASGMHDAVSSLKLVCGPTPEVAGRPFCSSTIVSSVATRGSDPGKAENATSRTSAISSTTRPPRSSWCGTGTTKYRCRLVTTSMLPRF